MATTTFHRKGLSALSAYTKGCRCSDCRAAKIKYEKMKRAKQHQEKKAKGKLKRSLQKPMSSLDHDTMTVSEYKKHRETEEAKRQFNQ